MHKQSIIHRDIKPENILMNSKDNANFEIRIADFGLASQLQEGIKSFHKCGTPSYIGPEVLRGRGYDFKADVFSVGSLFFNLVTGQFLFKNGIPS